MRIWRWAEKRRLGPPALRVALFALPILFLARTLIAYHPYEVVFFNSLAGGPSHAREKFELDYWGTSLLEASRWINANLPSGSRLWFTQPGIHRVKVDENRFFFVDPDDRPNYKISLLRGMVMTYDHDDDYLHPRRRVLHEITVKGAPILQIFEMEENRDVPEGATLTPASDAPPRLKPGLLATVSVDNKPPEKMPVQERLLIDCQRSPYRNHVTEMLAWGYLRVTAAGPYLFELYSDDFATVWLGKDAVIANVSTHTTHKTVVLSPGLYPMRMKYHNAAGEACLALRWKPQGATEIAILSTPDLLHDANTPKPATP